MHATAHAAAGSSTLSQLRRQAQQARATGQYAIAAGLEQQAAERAGALGWPGERSRALLWQGYSLSQAGEDDLALATLLQAVQEPTATDPADSFAALVAIIHLSLDRKSAAFSRNLLTQARRSLSDLSAGLSGGREAWAASLDWLEGELALRQGNAMVAHEWHQRAWTNWRDVHPRLTAATHLWALVRTAFRSGVAAEVQQWATELAALTGLTGVERQLALRARLLVWRAQRAALAEPVLAESLALARRLLVETVGQARDYGGRGEALRALALAGGWAEIEAELQIRPLANTEFAPALLAGDLALSRARLEQGGAVRDDEYAEYTVAAKPSAADGSPTVGATWRETARRCYQTALTLAESEDARLATNWHVKTLQQRLARL